MAVLRGDGRVGAELLENSPEPAPGGTVALREAVGGANPAKGDRPDGIALREAAEPATQSQDADGPPEGVLVHS